jgi:hypothetical protein
VRMLDELLVRITNTGNALQSRVDVRTRSSRLQRVGSKKSNRKSLHPQ